MSPSLAAKTVATPPVVLRETRKDATYTAVRITPDASLLVAPPHEAVATLVGLVEETYALAAQHVPGADVTGLREAFELRRVVDA